MKLTWRKENKQLGISWSGKDRTGLAVPVNINTVYIAGVLGPAGLPGPPGPTGASGTGGSNNLEPLVFNILISGAQILQLSKTTSFGLLFVNGLLQDPTSYSIANNQVIIPAGMGLIPNDVIFFIY